MPRNRWDWWDAINTKTGAFAAYVWIDDHTTLQQLLVDGGLRSRIPPYYVDNLQLAVTPSQRPYCGLTAPCKVMCGERRADTWWLQCDPAFEFRACLIDCYTDAAGVTEGDLASRKRAAQYVYHFENQLVCTIPELISGATSWWQDLRARNDQPAYLWITSNRTLNDILVSEKLASPSPLVLAQV